ncbi:MAG TPA: hypothetical protein VM933_02150 [Acidimicrobiales bacterium]|nr:hypothetical protein [Acidimicrobiales bacterium]
MEQQSTAAPAHPTTGPLRPSFWRRVAVISIAVTATTGSLAAASAQLDLPLIGTDAAGSATTSTSEAQPPTTDAAAPPAPAEPAAAAAPESGPGYRVVSADGGVFTHGWVGFAGSAAGETTSPTVGLAHTNDGDGYWLASADGGVFAFGSAAFHGSAPGASTHRVVDITATPSGSGYWLAAADGGVFAFGDAGYFGAGPEHGLPTKVVSIARTASGQGYWLVGSDGGVFTFGDAEFFGSLGDDVVNRGIIDLVPTATGLGYYLVAADGGVFTFGDAVFHGAAVGATSRSIVDMALHPHDGGYWLLASDGGVFSYGAAPFFGAPVGDSARPFTAIAAAVGRHAPAPLVEEPGPAPAEPVAEATVADPAPAPATRPRAAKAAGKADRRGAKANDKAMDGEFGWDISYPQCGGPYPEGASTYAIIGVNGGRAFRHNRCLAHQWEWARRRGAAGVYVNVNFPRSADELARGATSDRQPDCASGAVACVAYNFGLNGIRDSLAYASTQGVQVPFIWLDVEQLNYWTSDPALNAVVLRGAIDGVREAGLDVGIYSTPYQFGKLMGDEQPGVPVWTAGANGLGAVAGYCQAKGFGGGPAVLVQLLPGQYDPNLACPGAGPLSRYFRLPG